MSALVSSGIWTSPWACSSSSPCWVSYTGATPCTPSSWSSSSPCPSPSWSPTGSGISTQTSLPPITPCLKSRWVHSAHPQNNWHQHFTFFLCKILDFVKKLTNIVVSDWEDRLLPDCNVLGPLDTNCCPLPRHSNCSLIPAATQPLTARSFDNLLDLIRTIK